jgi:hypothetical protein
MKSINIKNTNIFDCAAYFITSIKAVILAISFLLIFLLIETTTLFVRQLPEDMSLFWRVVASIAIAFAFEFTVLIFTTNSDHSRKGLKPQHVLAIFHFLINTYFWQVFDFVDWIDLGYRLFLSFLFPYLTFHYAALFERKFREKKSDDQSFFDKISQQAIKYKSELDQLESIYADLKSDCHQLKQRNDDLTRNNVTLHNELSEVRSKLSRKKTKLLENGKILNQSG